VGNLHVNFTILVYSPTKITSLFYPISKFSYFCICYTPLNCYYFTRQSHPFAHLTSFRRITIFTTVYGSSVMQLPYCICFNIYIRQTEYVWPNKHGPKFRGLGPLLEKGVGSPSNTKSPGPRPSSIPSGILIHAAIWPRQIWAENWGAVPLWGGVAGSPSNTMWPGPRPTCMPSFILIRQTVWPQYTNVTDRQDDCPIA